jgi:hypothetical protein
VEVVGIILEVYFWRKVLGYRRFGWQAEAFDSFWDFETSS